MKSAKEERHLSAIMFTDMSVRAYTLLFMCAAPGDLDEAFGNLRRTAEIYSWPVPINYNPVFSKLRKDPRFREFCEIVGLPPSIGEPRG